MEDKILAVVKYPYEQAKVIAIEKGLKPLQEIVGGMITGADLPGIEGVYGYANDEGLLIGLEPNIYRPEYQDALVGPIVFTGADDEGNNISLTPRQVKEVKKYLNANSVSDFGEFLFHVETNFSHYKMKKHAEM